MPVSIDDEILDDGIKGIPGGIAPFAISEIASKNWNVLREDLPLPLAILKQSALNHNSDWMRTFIKASGAVLAPHGKTTMSPALFQRQLRDGAWAITLANVSQIQVARRFGISRIVLANQLVGRQAIRYVLQEMANDPQFDFYCLVDSVQCVQTLAHAAQKANMGRPLQVLVEGGIVGGRTGAHTLDKALKIARAVNQATPYLTLRGVEGFEGVISAPTPKDRCAGVTAFLDFLCEVAHACDAENLFGEEPIILSAGGSAYYDLVVKAFSKVHLSGKTMILVRSGCYLTHDSIVYETLLEELLLRNPGSDGWGEPPKPALEVWAYVQSRPEPGRVILTMGKRDTSYDAGLPLAFGWVRPRKYQEGQHQEVQPLEFGHVCVDINDQHLFMDVPFSSKLEVGDMVGFGISHPCLTFDKWQFMPIVDDEYNIVSAIKTYF